jgi:hypothetical protein
MPKTFNATELWEDFKRREAASEAPCLPEGPYRLAVAACTFTDNSVSPVFWSGAHRQYVSVGKLVLTEKSAGIFFRHMHGFGLKEDFFNPLLSDTAVMMKAIADALTGRVVEAVLLTEPYRGVRRNKLKVSETHLVSTTTATLPPGWLDTDVRAKSLQEVAAEAVQEKAEREAKLEEERWTHRIASAQTRAFDVLGVRLHADKITRGGGDSRLHAEWTSFEHDGLLFVHDASGGRDGDLYLLSAKGRYLVESLTDLGEALAKQKLS